jgi:MYXO-CTERM domain-containing protein
MTGAAGGNGLGADGLEHAVPLLPEADALSVLVGGLLALGALVGWRKRRPPGRALRAARRRSRPGTFRARAHG